MVSFLDSVRDPMELYLGATLDWEQVAAEVRSRVQQVIAVQGAFINHSTAISYRCTRTS